MISKFYILLPVHNRKLITENFIKSLVVQTYQQYTLILIDDGSTDNTAEMVREYIPSEKLVIINGTGKLWWAGSLQKGYDFLLNSSSIDHSNEWVVIINDDTIVEKDYLFNAARIVTNSQSTIFLSEAYDIKDSVLIDKGVHVDWKTLSFRKAYRDEEVNCFSTRGLFIKVSDFLKTGGFYPKLLPHYGSDYEFTIRAHRKGLALRTDHSIRLYSNESTTGYHNVNKTNAGRNMKILFSKKSADNPFYWIIFIWLACPLRYKLKHTIRISLGFIKNYYFSKP